MKRVMIICIVLSLFIVSCSGGEPPQSEPTASAPPISASPIASLTPLPASPTASATPLPASPTASASPLPASPTATPSVSNNVEDELDESTAQATPTAESEEAVSEEVMTSEAKGRLLAEVLPELAEGWSKVEPGGETRCAHDTEYAFWVRPGQINKLLVYFQGGGGCWDAESCAPGSRYYDQSVSAQDDPASRQGILDFDNPQNPFKDYYAVYAPSCTGDIYMGTKAQTYRAADGSDLTIHHKGSLNGQAVINWLFEHFSAPERIFVTGCSAGSIGSAMFAPHLMEHYPDSDVTQLGDSLGFLFSSPVDVDGIYGAHAGFASWIPALQEIEPGDFTMTGYYTAVASYYPERTFAQFNSAFDHIQVFYYTAGGRDQAGFGDALQGAIDNIHASAPNFRSYTAEGTQHCIMPRSDFYRRELNGVSFRDWVDNLAKGVDVESVRCVDCGKE